MTAGSHSQITLCFIRNCQTVLQRGCTLLHPHQPGRRAHVAPHPRLHLASVLCISDVPAGASWGLIVTHRFKVREKPTIQYILPYLIKTHHKKVYNGENKCLKPSAQSPQLNTVDLLPHSQAEVSRGKVWTARTLYILLFREALE